MKTATLLFCLGTGLLSVAGVGAAEQQATPVMQAVQDVAQNLGRITVRGPQGALVADGRSAARFHVAVLSADGQPVEQGFVVVTASDGWLLDLDGKAVSGTVRFPIRQGAAEFSMVAPAQAGVVTLEVQFGTLKASGKLPFAAEARDMVAVGTFEQIISQRHLQAGAVAPVNFNDSFDKELTYWSRSLGDETNLAGRLAFFLKGKISGDVVLTAAYDSDKDTRQKLSQIVDPNAVYPVYGDSSFSTMEAKSSERLFVRLDKDKNFLLFGDFSVVGAGDATAVAMLQNTRPLVSLLGRYNRTATGIRGHYDQHGVLGDGFVTNDSLKQVVEEQAANGTSGPFAISNTNAVQNSERVEVLVRDRNQRGVIKSVTSLVRYVDYSFEPFSGRVLLTKPLASLTPSGDAQSLRISYEVDQGGPSFYTYGLNGSTQLLQGVRLGGSYVQDENPLAPYRLSSVNTELLWGEHLRLTLESAQTQSSQFLANGQLFATPSGQVGETGAQTLGQANRIDLGYEDAGRTAHLWWMQADTHFNNLSSGMAAGRLESGLAGKVKLNDAMNAYVEYTHTEDALTNGIRQSGKLGITDWLTPELQLDLSIRNLSDNSQIPQEAQIAGNSNGTGGFSGNGAANNLIDPLSGAMISTLASTGTVPAATKGHGLDATTARAGLLWKPRADLQLDAGIEGGVNGEDYYRLDAGALYTLTPDDHLFARFETQSGLSSPSSLNYADRSRALSAGLVHGVSAETSLFSEYKMLDANSDNAPARMDQMLANGLQNRHAVGDGVVLTSSAEYLSILSGAQREAAAIATGLDYTGNPLWRASSKLEFRRLFDDKSIDGDQSQDQWLATLSVARKLDSEWTLLVKNFYLLQINHADLTGSPMGPVRQERFITGLAWRPTEHNRFNMLARYEYKAVDDESHLLGDRYDAHIGSVSMDYRPERHWWATTRLAAKRSSDFTASSPDQTFNAWLWSGRFTVDVTEKVDLGVMVSSLNQDSTAQSSAAGVEAGYRVAKNVWVSAGYNWSGFYDRDLSGSDYTAQGPYLRLRAKFDENLFGR